MAPTSPPAPPDKRKASRLNAPKVVVRIPSVERFRTHYLKDISEGGLFVKAEKVLPAGAMLALELWPPGWDQALEVAGKVTRSVDPAAAAAEGRPCGMAVRFVNIPPEVDQQLKALVEEHGTAVEAPAADPVGAQVEAVVRELAAAREKVSQLNADLVEARGQSEAFTEQIHKLEQEESEARAATARAEGQRDDLERQLAAETARLTAERDELQRRLEKETARSAQLGGTNAELQRKLEKEKARADGLAAEKDALQRKLEDATSKAEAEQARSKEQLEVVTGEFEALTRKFAKEREEAKTQRERAERLARDLEKREARERGLRSLLDRVSGQGGDATGGDEDEVVVVGGSDAETAHEKSEAEEEPPVDAEVEAVDAIEESEGAFAKGPEGPGAAPDVDLDFDLDDLDLDDQTIDDKKESAPASPSKAAASAEPDSFEAFNATLKPRTRLLAGDRLSDHAPKGDQEKLVIELLGASPTFGTLISQLEGRVPEDELRRMLCLLHAGALIELRN